MFAAALAPVVMKPACKHVERAGSVTVPQSRSQSMPDRRLVLATPNLRTGMLWERDCNLVLRLFPLVRARNKSFSSPEPFSLSHSLKIGLWVRRLKGEV